MNILPSLYCFSSKTVDNEVPFVSIRNPSSVVREEGVREQFLDRQDDVMGFYKTPPT